MRLESSGRVGTGGDGGLARDSFAEGLGKWTIQTLSTLGND